MEGTNGGEVCLNCFGLYSPGEAGDPGHDSGLRAGEDGAVDVVQAVEPAEVDETLLAGTVGFACVGREPVPKIK